MSAPKPDLNLHAKPTPDDLAGTPVCKEELNSKIRIRGSGSARVRGPRRKRGRGAPAAPQPQGPPTADDLAGIPVSAEDEEDLIVRPRKPFRHE